MDVPDHGVHHTRRGRALSRAITATLAFNVRIIMRVATGAVLILLTGVAMSAQTRTFDFEQDAVGQPPKGFLFAHTAKTGAPGRWVVQQDGSAKCLAQTDPDRTRSRFPIAVVTDVSAADVDLSVRFKPISGR